MADGPGWDRKLTPICGRCGRPKKNIQIDPPVWECEVHGVSNFDPVESNPDMVDNPPRFGIRSEAVTMVDEISSFKYPDVPAEAEHDIDMERLPYPEPEPDDILHPSWREAQKREHIQDSVQASAEMDRDRRMEKLASKPSNADIEAGANRDAFGPGAPKPAKEKKEFGPVGNTIGIVVSLSIAAPFIIILWKWALALVF